MLLTLYTCLLWLIISGLQTIQAQDTNENMSARSPYWKLSPNNINFAFYLFQYLVGLNPNENVIFSPISISMALSMMSLGAGTQTGIKILRGLGFDTSQIPEAEIHESFQQIYKLLGKSELNIIMGNTLFFKQYLQLMDLPSDNLKHYYGLEKVPINVRKWSKGRNQINEYIKNKTRGEISDLFSKLKDRTNLALINYIFFTGLWVLPFNPEETKEGNFYGKDMNVIKVPIMYQMNNFKLLYDPLLHCMVVLLDYVGNSTFYFILTELEELDHIIKALNQFTLQRWSESVITRTLELYIPKFCLSGTYDLGDVMKNMGIADLKKKEANMANLTGNAKRKLKKVLHKAKLEVNEYGLPPGNYTNNTAPRSHRPSMVRIDQPFIFMILDNISQSIIFLGKVMTPV